MEIDRSITMDDVIGLDRAKEVLFRRLVDYFKFKDRVKIPPSKGILLYGYPGTGKTMLVNAVVNSLNNSNIYFRVVECSDLTAYVGTTEAKVKKFFKDVRKKAGGKEIVLLMDEVDQLVPRKLSTQSQIVLERVSALLRILDGLEINDSGVFIIATTNHPEKIEDAFVRSGRIDRHIEVNLPNWEEREELCIKYLMHIPGVADKGDLTNIDIIVDHTDGWTGADFKKLAGELEVVQFKQGKPLSAEQITSIYFEVRNERKGNFKRFREEYKRYREASL